MENQYSRHIGPAIALITASLMATEIILTRIFSVIIWYHFAFLAISVALFGTGVASMLVHIGQRRLAPEKTRGFLAMCALAMTVAIATVDLVMINVTPDWFGDASLSTFTNITFKLVAIFVLATSPFFFAGAALSLAMLRFSGHIHRLYFWDLSGAALGCIAAVPLLSRLGGPAALLAAAALATAAACALTPVLERARRKYLVAAAAMLLGLGAIGALNPWLGWLDIGIAKGVNLRVIRPEFNRWNSFSMVTVLPDFGFRGWGLSPAYTGPIPEQKTLVIDMNAMTPLTRFDGSLDKVDNIFYDLSALVYRVHSRPTNVCVIGAGGGRDVLAALVAGSRHVTAVEINPLIVEDVVKGQYRAFTGDLYHRSDVSVQVEDGRSFVRRSADRYDVVLLSMVDTSAATAAGAYALTENGLYTSDAFGDFMSKLKPGGILSVSTVSLPGLKVGARLAAVARAALIARGRDPSRSVAVAQTPWLHLPDAMLNDFIIKPDGFTEREVTILQETIKSLSFMPAYLPGRIRNAPGLEPGWISTILRSQDPAELERAMNKWPVDVSAVNDNRPFFFYQNRARDLGRALFGETGYHHLFGNGLVVLAKVALVAIVMACVFLLLPIAVARRRWREGGGAAGWDLGYVACLGIGFMFLEIALIQRFMLYLGNPTYTLVVVLFILLLFGGAGSRLFSGSVKPGSRRTALLAVFGALAFYALGLGSGIGAISDATWSWAPAARAVLSGFMIAPLGLLLGMPFPTGLSAISRRADTRIPWLWSINSATSVLGSVLATMTSLQTGIQGTLVAGALIYVCAALLWLKVGAGVASQN